jgi:hypothetical protein
MARQKLRIKPLAYLYDLSQAPYNASPLTAQWPSMNVMISSNRVERRWDHEVFRTFDSTDTIQAIPIFRTNLGTTYVLALTETDLVKIMGGTGETYQYLTQTWATGSVSNVVTTAVTGATEDCQWFDTSGVASGDKFIMGDDHSAAIEPDTNWATVASVESNTGITLSAAYTGTDTSGAYKLRKVYSVPSGERWQYASVNGKFCFVNGNVYGQYWNGTDTYATDINKTYCNQVRYCVSFANRLVTADMYYADDSARNPWLLRWSKEGDPTDWTDSTAGFNEFIDTEEPITGLGVSGSNLIVFKKTSYYMGYRTGEASSPITFPGNKRGIGLYAPYSLVHIAGTVAWAGLSDFYFLNGDEAEPIGGPIRKKFFDLVADDELELVFGINNARYNEILWVANTSVGQYVFSYNWKEKAWTTYQFDTAMTGLGGWTGA